MNVPMAVVLVMLLSVAGMAQGLSPPPPQPSPSPPQSTPGYHLSELGGGGQVSPQAWHHLQTARAAGGSAPFELGLEPSPTVAVKDDWAVVVSSPWRENGIVVVGIELWRAGPASWNMTHATLLSVPDEDSGADPVYDGLRGQVSVDMDSGHLAVGLSGLQPGAGAVARLANEGGSLRLLDRYDAPPGVLGFGRSVALYEHRLAVGAQDAVFLFTSNPDAGPSDVLAGPAGSDFGAAVAATPELVAVGAPRTDTIHIYTVAESHESARHDITATFPTMRDVGVDLTIAEGQVVAAGIQDVDGQRRLSAVVVPRDQAGTPTALHVDALQGGMPARVAHDGTRLVLPTSEVLHTQATEGRLPALDSPHRKDRVADIVPEANIRFGMDIAAHDGHLLVAQGPDIVHFLRSGPIAPMPPVPCLMPGAPGAGPACPTETCQTIKYTAGPGLVPVVVPPPMDGASAPPSGPMPDAQDTMAAPSQTVMPLPWDGEATSMPPMDGPQGHGFLACGPLEPRCAPPLNAEPDFPFPVPPVPQDPPAPPSNASAMTKAPPPIAAKEALHPAPAEAIAVSTGSISVAPGNCRPPPACAPDGTCMPECLVYVDPGVPVPCVQATCIDCPEPPVHPVKDLGPPKQAQRGPDPVPLRPDAPTRLNPDPRVLVEYFVHRPVDLEQEGDVTTKAPRGLPSAPGAERLGDQARYLDIRHADADDVAQLQAAQGRIRLQIGYDETALPEGVTADRLTLHFWNGADWVPLRGPETIEASTDEGPLTVHGVGIDRMNRTVWAEVDHTSTYALGVMPDNSVHKAPVMALDGPWFWLSVLTGLAIMIWLTNLVLGVRRRLERAPPRQEPEPVLEAPAISIDGRRDA